MKRTDQVDINKAVGLVITDVDIEDHLVLCFSEVYQDLLLPGLGLRLPADVVHDGGEDLLPPLLVQEAHRHHPALTTISDHGMILVKMLLEPSFVLI